MLTHWSYITNKFYGEYPDKAIAHLIKTITDPENCRISLASSDIPFPCSVHFNDSSRNTCVRKCFSDFQYSTRLGIETKIEHSNHPLSYCTKNRPALPCRINKNIAQVPKHYSCSAASLGTHCSTAECTTVLIFSNATNNYQYYQVRRQYPTGDTLCTAPHGYCPQIHSHVPPTHH